MTYLQSRSVSCVWPAHRLLGEGAWWSATEQAVYWVDIKRPAILRYVPETTEKAIWNCPEPIGSCAPRSQGGLVLAMKSGIYTCSLGEPGTPVVRQFLVAPAELGPGDRFNDGKCHPDGTFWAGTMDDDEKATRGWFYRFDGGKLPQVVTGPYLVCNGPAFSADGRIAYFADSARRLIFRADVSVANFGIERFVDFGASDGFPDGMTTDIQGRLWVAMWDGGKVLCLSTRGERLMEIKLPAIRPTSCAFGGKYLRTLYITSASIGLPAGAAENSCDGSLFAVEIEGAQGWPTAAFRG